MSEIEIRPACSDELSKIATLLDAAELPVEDLTEEKLREFLVAVSEEECVGVVGLEVLEPNALLRSLAVSPAQRDKGLGTRLLQTIERQAKNRGVTTLFLLTTTAGKFFANAGSLHTNAAKHHRQSPTPASFPTSVPTPRSACVVS